jgi:DNA recombination protein RmuC
VRLPDPPGPLPIDARFPIEAFAALRAAAPADPRAENEFRRAALRHIAEVAERLIRPGDASAAAMLFLPSETMSAELHARFPDVVEDSYRARGWIVSPTSLMASLTALKAVLRTAGAMRTAPNDRMVEELETLRRRVAALETGGALSRPAAQAPAAAAADPPAPSEPAPEPDLWEDRREADDGSARLPFPLR